MSKLLMTAILLRFTLPTIQPPQMPANNPLSKTLQAALVGLAFLLPPIDSIALEWSAQPSISATSTVNDNIDLVANPDGTVWSSTISPQLTLRASSARSTLSGQAQLDRVDYSDDSELSRTYGLLHLAFARQYERSQLSLGGRLVSDTTLESELTETGVVESHVQRTKLSLSPSWAYSITERDSVNFGYDYADVSYDDTTTTSTLTDYTVKNPSVTLSHAFTEKNKLNLSLGYSDYQSQTPVSLTTSQSQYTTTSAQLGFSRDFSETLSVSLMAGIHKTDSRVNGLACLPIFLPSCFAVPVEDDNSDTGSLFNARLQQAFESSLLTAELSRSLRATGENGLVQTDRLSGSYEAKLTPTISSSLNLSIHETQYSEVSRNTNNSRYYRITPAISWQITEWWSARTSYSRSVSQDENDTEATGNAISLTLNYNWPSISKSR